MIEEIQFGCIVIIAVFVLVIISIGAVIAISAHWPF